MPRRRQRKLGVGRGVSVEITAYHNLKAEMMRKSCDSN
jgi:hypothetical protein